MQISKKDRTFIFEDAYDGVIIGGANDNSKKTEVPWYIEEKNRNKNNLRQYHYFNLPCAKLDMYIRSNARNLMHAMLSPLYFPCVVMIQNRYLRCVPFH